MTNFEKIKLMSKDALADWLDKLSECSEEAPWLTWFAEKYCDNCGPIYEGSDKTQDFAYCELHDNCKYFPNEDMSIPTNLIKKWFEQEAE